MSLPCSRWRINPVSSFDLYRAEPFCQQKQIFKGKSFLRRRPQKISRMKAGQNRPRYAIAKINITPTTRAIS
jgi:hypothetical protein